MVLVRNSPLRPVQVRERERERGREREREREREKGRVRERFTSLKHSTLDLVRLGRCCQNVIWDSSTQYDWCACDRGGGGLNIRNEQYAVTLLQKELSSCM